MRYYTYREHEEHRTDRLPVAYYCVDAHHPRYEMTHHWHKEFEIIFVRRGHLQVTLDGVAHSLSAGAMLFVNSGVIHSGHPENAEYECVVFGLETAVRQYLAAEPEGRALLAQELLLPTDVFLLHPAAAKEAERLVTAMREEKPGFMLTALSAIAGLFGLVLRQEILVSQSPKSNGFTTRLLPFENAVSFMEENFAEPITLGEMATAAGISRKYFSEYFKKVSGKSPFEYLTSYRIERASELLLHTDLPITQIALDCGFNDLSYFIKTFKKQTEITPAKWRHEKRA